MSKKLLIAAVIGAGLVAVPTAGAEPGPPQQGGGCNMVFGPAFHAPNSSGLDNMMAGSANGAGSGNMGIMLSRFSDLTFCLY